MLPGADTIAGLDGLLVEVGADAAHADKSVIANGAKGRFQRFGLPEPAQGLQALFKHG